MTASGSYFLVVRRRNAEEEQCDQSSGGEDQSDHCHYEAAGAKVRQRILIKTEKSFSHASPQFLQQGKPGSRILQVIYQSRDTAERTNLKLPVDQHYDLLKDKYSPCNGDWMLKLCRRELEENMGKLILMLL